MRFSNLIPAVAALGLLAMATGPAMAAAPVPFTQAAFEASQKAGKPILVHVEASWWHHLRPAAPDPGEARGRAEV